MPFCSVPRGPADSHTHYVNTSVIYPQGSLGSKFHSNVVLKQKKTGRGGKYEKLNYEAHCNHIPDSSFQEKQQIIMTKKKERDKNKSNNLN